MERGVIASRALPFGLVTALLAAAMTLGCDSGSSEQGDAGAAGDARADGGRCVLRTCADIGATCGVIDDRCGKLIDCGQCEWPDSCGAVEDNKCGCKPLTCEAAGANCDNLYDGCGGDLYCGECESPDVCGGGGANNVCGHPLCNDGWCYQNPYPQADTLFAVFEDDAGNVFAGGVGGAIIRHDGKTWDFVPSFTRTLSDIRGLWVSGPQSGWAVGTNGAILRYDGDIFLCFKNETDYWSPVEYDLFGIWAASESEIWAVGEEGILKWDGSAWTEAQKTLGPLYAIAGQSASDLWAAGSRLMSGKTVPYFLHYDGQTWKTADPGNIGANGTVLSLFVADDGMVWAAGKKTDSDGKTTGGLIITYDGSSWVEIVADITDGLNAVAADGSGKIWMAGDQGALLMWNKKLYPQPKLLGPKDIFGFFKTDKYLHVVGAHGLVGRHDGLVWRLNLTEIPFSSADEHSTGEMTGGHLWAGGRGWMMNWNGTTWGTADVDADIAGIWGVAYDRAWAAGNRSAAQGKTEGVVFAFDGKRWTEDTAWSGQEITDLSGTSSTDVRAYLKNGDIERWDGESWTLRKPEDFPEPVEGYPQGSGGWSLDPEYGFSELLGEGESSYDTRIWPWDGLQAPVHTAWGSDGSVWAGGEDGVIEREYDGFFRHHLQASIVSISGSGTHDVWLGGKKNEDGKGPLWHSTGGIPLDAHFGEEDHVNSVSVTADGQVFVAAARIYRMTDNGWDVVHSGTGGEFRAIWAFSAQDLWAAAGYSIFHFDGSQWSELNPQDLMDRPPMGSDTRIAVDHIYGVDADSVFFTGSTPDQSCAVLIAFDGGAWGNGVLCSMYETAVFTSLWGVSAEDMWVTMGDIGYIYHYMHSTRFFDYVEAPIYEPLGALWGTPEKEIWAFGPYGVILHQTP